MYKIVIHCSSHWQAEKQPSVTKVIIPFSENLVQVANFPINNELSFTTKRGRNGRETDRKRESETEMDRDRDGQKQTDREIDRQMGRDSESKTEK